MNIESKITTEIKAEKFKTPWRINLETSVLDQLKSFIDDPEKSNKDKKIAKNLAKYLAERRLVKIVVIPAKDKKNKSNIVLDVPPESGHEGAWWSGNIGQKRCQDLLKVIFSNNHEEYKEINRAIKEKREVFLKLEKKRLK